MRTLPGILTSALVVVASCRRSPAPSPPPPAIAAPAATPPAAPATTPPAAPAAPAQPGAAAPSAAAPSPLSVQQTVQTLLIQSGAATLFRHHDGNWHARVTFSIRNTGTEPVDVRRESFIADELAPTGDLSHFPDTITLNPGLSVTGDIAWWRAAHEPQPGTLVVKYRPGDESSPVLATQRYTPVLSPLQPARGAAPTAVVHTLPVTPVGTGLTFVHSDGNRHFRVTFTVRNPTTAPLLVHRELFHATVGDTEAGLASQTELTSWGDPATVAPGASVTGTVGFWLSGDPSPNPTALHVRFGPTVSPQAEFDAPVAAGPSPLP